MCIDPFYHETQISGDMNREEWNLPKKIRYLMVPNSTSHLRRKQEMVGEAISRAELVAGEK